MKVVLQDTALLVANAVAKDGRPALGCVQIKDGKAMATDGLMLVEHPVETQDMDGQAVLVPAGAIKAARAKSIGTKSGRGRHQRSTRVRKVTVEPRETDLLVSGEYTILCPQMKASFPDFDHVKKGMIQSSEVTGYGKFQVSVLKKLLSTCAGDWIILQFRDPKAGVEFISGEAHGIVMPAFLDEKQYKWYELPPEPPKPETSPLPSAEDQAKMYEEMTHGE